MDATRTRQRVAGAGPHIFPSLLACDFGVLAEEIGQAARCGAPAVHWDVMDGRFVPNLTYGAPVIRSLRCRSELVFDAHLMMAEPERYLDDFLAAGCDIITVHVETDTDIEALVERIRGGGALAGLALNPPTAVERLEPWIGRVDLILVMSVMPGFGGQQFDSRALAKLRWIEERFGPEVVLQVDGGINRGTIRDVVQAGARALVVGSAFYGASDRAAEFEALMQLARQGQRASRN